MATESTVVLGPLAVGKIIRALKTVIGTDDVLTQAIALINADTGIALNIDAQGNLTVNLPAGLASDAGLAAILAKLSADPATQTTLAAVLAKLSADPATQTTLAAVLAKITADPATQTTLAAVLAKITADPATQTTLAALLAAVATAAKQDTMIAALGDSADEYSESNPFTVIALMKQLITLLTQFQFSGGAALTAPGSAGSETQILTDATATGTATSTQLSGSMKAEATYLATLGANDTQAATATVKIYGSRVAMASAAAADKVELATLSLSGTGDTDNDTVVDTDAVAVGAHFYPYVWAEVTAITGTGAQVQAYRMV